MDISSFEGVITESLNQVRFDDKKREYKVYMMEVAGAKMQALIPASKNLVVPAHIKIEDVRIGKLFDAGTNSYQLAFFILNFSVADPDDDCAVSDYLEVRFEGKVRKSEKSVMHRVGSMDKRFISCTVIIGKGKEKYRLLLVAFNGNAAKVDQFKDGVTIVGEARLRARRDGKGLELNLTRLL